MAGRASRQPPRTGVHAKETGFLPGVEQSREAMVTSVMRAFNNEDAYPVSLAETFLSSQGRPAAGGQPP